MRRIILSINITEDGFIAGSQDSLDWHFPFWCSDMAEAMGKLLNKADTILLGKNTYIALEAYWPVRKMDISIARIDITLAEIMNTYKKIVISKTLETASWKNSAIIRNDILKEIKLLKEKPGKDIILLGSCRLFSYLIIEGMIDEVHLWLHPVSIQKGRRSAELSDFILTHTMRFEECFSSGVRKITSAVQVPTASKTHQLEE